MLRKSGLCKLQSMQDSRNLSACLQYLKYVLFATLLLTCLGKRGAGIGKWWGVCWTQTAVPQIWFLNLLCDGEKSTEMATQWVVFQNSYLCQIIVNFSSTKKEFANFLWIFWCWTRLWDHTSKWCPCIWSKSSFCYLHLASISKILLSMSISNARPW